MFDTPGLRSGPLVRLVSKAMSAMAKRFGWATVRYASVSIHTRLKQFKRLSLGLDAGTTIRFNDHLVPYIQAETDTQAAVALGCVTEFLRGPQLQFLKRLAQGRLSEMGGARYVEMDHLIRILNFGHATQDMLKAMPVATMQWVEAFVQGLNCVQNQRGRGLDERLLGIKPEPYTIADILLLGRLAGADVNWPIYFSLLECEDDKAALRWWARLGGNNVATELAEVLSHVGRSGSNCLAVAASHSSTGAPLLAGDPHLGQHLPNIWMMVGLRSPSYQCVGLMFPGAPVLGMGRNWHVAWGGTNLRAASTDMVLLPADVAPVSSSTTQIKVRWGFTRQRVLEHSEHGPLLHTSSALAPMLRGRRIALKWAGHWPTDEISGFLGMMASRQVDDVHASIRTMGVTPLNIVSADTHGNIRHSLATTLPKRQGFDAGWLLQPHAANEAWSNRLTGLDLPSLANPSCGFLVSTNNQPMGATQVSFYFNGDERHARASALLGNLKSVGVEDLLKVQMDATSPRAMRLSRELSEWLRYFATSPQQHSVCEALAQWDGCYGQSSVACLYFEATLSELIKGMRSVLPPSQGIGLVEEWAYLSQHLMADLLCLSLDVQRSLALAAMAYAPDWAKQWGTWGRVHKVRPRHVLGYVPFLGKLFSAKALAADGSRETLHKNAHGLLRGYTESAYGSQARHWHDLSDPDANHFVLLGGQDGWLGSQLMTDQIALWCLRQTIRMPLSEDLIAHEFPYR